MIHITKNARPTGRRVNDARGQRQNLCGAALTDRDVTVAQARQIVRSGWGDAADRCDVCFGRLLQMDFARSDRVED